jgi:hypothetical protein
MGAAVSLVTIALLSGALAVGSFLCCEEGIHHNAAEPQPKRRLTTEATETTEKNASAL